MQTSEMSVIMLHTRKSRSNLKLGALYRTLGTNASVRSRPQLQLIAAAVRAVQHM